MPSYAILVDGGFAKRKLGTAKSPATAQHFHKLIQRLQASEPLQTLTLHRVYYYDAAPLESAHERPLGGGTIEFEKEPIVNRSRQLFEQLAQIPYMALRLGELSFEGWEIGRKSLAQATGPQLTVSASDLRPKISQKGVDMRIGMDIAALTLKRQVNTIVLVTGDSDFVPAMKFARREGAHLFLCSLGQKVKPSMLEHSDLVIELPLT